MKMKFVIFRGICFSIFLVNYVITCETNLEVNVKNGTIRGTLMYSSKGRQFYSFRGIPYAQPPVGPLRFHDPLPPNSWKGIRSAENDSNICPQMYAGIDKIFGDEDCLYLNVFTPKLPNNGSINPLPVIIWIHGGSYKIGDGRSLTYGPKYLLNHDIVLVSLNYRLGVLGFLSTEDLSSPGNYGLKDQTLAIRWVKENILKFNGDPNKITLYGQSAGGASVHYHMISPLSRGLFHRAISQSGNSYGRWYIYKSGYAKNNAKRLGNLLSCPSSDSEALLKCLRTKDPSEFVKAVDLSFPEIGAHPSIPFPSVIEPSYPGAFISENPRKLINRGQFQDVPWMTGITSQEGGIASAHPLGLKNLSDDKVLDEHFLQYAPIVLLYREHAPKKNHDKISKMIREFYFGDKPINDLTRENMTNMLTDAWFLTNDDEALRDHIKQKASSPIYNYFFAYRGKVSYSQITGDPKIDYGVSHTDDVQYLLDIRKLLFPNVPMNEEELQMVDLMTTLWTNFAYTGNPTPDITPIIKTKWEPVRTPNLEYLHIGKPTDIQMKANLLPERVNLWREIISLYSE